VCGRYEKEKLQSFLTLKVRQGPGYRRIGENKDETVRQPAHIPWREGEVEEDAILSTASEVERPSVTEDVQVGFLCSHLLQLVHIIISEILKELEAAELVSISRAH
jgi:hypothetical protein